jgi:hypothetical protein
LNYVTLVNSSFFDNSMFRLCCICVKVPTGMALFPVELFAPIQYWASGTYENIVQWNHMPSGGHFAAMEEPLLLAKELWLFLQKTSPAPVTSFSDQNVQHKNVNGDESLL